MGCYHYYLLSISLSLFFFCIFFLSSVWSSSSLYFIVIIWGRRILHHARGGHFVSPFTPFGLLNAFAYVSWGITLGGFVYVRELGSRGGRGGKLSCGGTSWEDEEMSEAAVMSLRLCFSLCLRFLRLCLLSSLLSPEGEGSSVVWGRELGWRGGRLFPSGCSPVFPRAVRPLPLLKVPLDSPLPFLLATPLSGGSRPFSVCWGREFGRWGCWGGR